MKLYAMSSLEDLLEKADVLCVPSSKESADFLYAEILTRLVHPDALPPLAELLAMKSTPSYFYCQWQGHRIKVIFWCEGEKLTEASVYTLARKMAIKVKSDSSGKAGLMVHHLDAGDIIQSAFSGWAAGQYELGVYKQSDHSNSKPGSGEVYTFLPGGISEDIAKDGITIGLVQQEVMNLVNTPASHKSPASLGAWASRSAAQYGYVADILDKQQLITLGMHALLAVNRGSEQPAQCIVTHYNHPEAAKKIVIVGKGVIFDTGGLSVKPSKNLHYMKSDMAGAAAALGIVEACARLKLKVNIIAIAPTTDNSIDSLSIKPGDVISSFAGKTIEVIDTDAEGRLVLADAIAYAIKEYKPDVIIDMATLTGSIVASLGPQAAGLFSKNNQLAAELESAGNISGERVWRMPMYDEYHEDMQSDIADIKNLSEKPYAGATTAAKFLEFFTSEHPCWAHLDIAGMGFQPNGFGKGYCATGYGIRLLLRWLSLNGERENVRA